VGSLATGRALWRESDCRAHDAQLEVEEWRECGTRPCMCVECQVKSVRGRTWRMARPDPTHATPCTWPRGWQQTWRPRGVQAATSAISRIGTRWCRQFEGSTSSVRSRSPDGKVGRSFRCRCSRVRCPAVVWCDRSVERGSNQGTPSCEPGMDRRQLIRL
jgi:hypothetical protein